MISVLTGPTEEDTMTRHRCFAATLPFLAILVLSAAGSIATAPPARALEVVPVPWNSANPNGTPEQIPHPTYNGHPVRFKAIARGNCTNGLYSWDLDNNGAYDDHLPTPPRDCFPDGLGSFTCYDLGIDYYPPPVTVDSFFDIQFQLVCDEGTVFANYPVLVYAGPPTQPDPLNHATSLPQLATDEERAVMTNAAIGEALWYLHLQMTGRAGVGAEMTGSFTGPQPEATAAAFLWLAYLNGHMPAYPPGTYAGPEPHPGWLLENDERWNGDPYAETALRAFNGLVASLAPLAVDPWFEENDGTTPIPGTDDGKGLAGGSLEPFDIGQLLSGLAMSGLYGTTMQVGDATHVLGQPLEAVVQQIVDTVVSLQLQGGTDDDGGWGSGGGATHESDAAQWNTMGLRAALEKLQAAGVHVPQHARSRLASVLIHNQDPLTRLARPTNTTCTDTGGYGITGGSLAGAGLLGWDRLEPESDGSVLDLDWSGLPISSGQARLALEDYLLALGAHYVSFQLDCTGEVSGLWDNDGGTNPDPWLRTDDQANVISMYSTQKGARTVKPEVSHILGGHDWFAEFGIYLVRAQENDGSWLDQPWGGGAIPPGVALGRELSTAYAALVLTPTLFDPAPVCEPGDVDLDSDGYCAGGPVPDCDDADPASHPGGYEYCDGADNDCDGPADEYMDTDADGDGITRPGSCDGGANDCDDTRGDLWSRPGEALELRLMRYGVPGIDLSWNPPADPGGMIWYYDVLVGMVIPDFLAPQTSCLESDDGDEIAFDPDDPLPGELHAYLVAAENPCGRGPLGWRTSGEERLGIDCVPPPPPVADFIASPNPAACEQVISFDASSSFHPVPGASIVEYRWEFDDGDLFNSPSPTATHAYSLFGEYHVRLTVLDDQVPQQQDTTERPVSVSLGNTPPVADGNGPYVIEMGDDLVLDASGSSDPNEPCGDAIVIFEWDLDTDGTLDISFTDPVGVVPWASLAGLQAWPSDPGTGLPTQTMLLRVTDSFGAWSDDTTTLTVYDNNPVAVLAANPNPTSCGVIVNFDASGSYHGHPSHSIVRYDWDFGDGSTVDDGGPLVQHPYGGPGQFDATVVVTDDNDPARQHLDTVTIDVTCVEPAVDAGPDEEGYEGVVEEVIATFVDPDPGQTHTATIDWGDGTPPEPAVVDPDLGIVMGTHVYADNNVYPVTVQVVDSFGLPGDDTALLTIYNMSPVLYPIPTQMVPFGLPLELEEAFIDPGTLDTHTATIDWGEGPVEPAVVTEEPFGPPGSETGLTGTVAGSHIYSSVGVWMAHLCVTDDDGGIHCETFEVDVSLP
jgi:hypothetical protein